MLGPVGRRLVYIPAMSLVVTLLIALAPTRADADIIGIDNRERLTPTDYNVSRRAVGLLSSTRPNGTTLLCTAWIYGTSPVTGFSVVATAGHCVYNKYTQFGVTSGPGAYHSNFRFYPAIDGSTSPYGYCGWFSSVVSSGWFYNGLLEEDYGHVELNCAATSTTGRYNLKTQTASYDDHTAHLSGYPGVPPFGNPNNTQFRGTGPIRASDPQQLRYSMDFTNGQSGGPVWHEFGDCASPCAIAIANTHTYGGSVYNRGVRITQQVLNDLVAWRDI